MQRGPPTQNHAHIGSLRCVSRSHWFCMISCPLVLLPLCPRTVPTEGHLVAKRIWTVGSKASVVGPSPAHPEQKQLGVTLTSASGSVEWLWPSFCSFSAEPLVRLVLREHPVLFSGVQDRESASIHSGTELWCVCGAM